MAVSMNICVGVLTTGALLFGVYVRAPEFWKLPCSRMVYTWASSGCHMVNFRILAYNYHLSTPTALCLEVSRTSNWLVNCNQNLSEGP